MMPSLSQLVSQEGSQSFNQSISQSVSNFMVVTIDLISRCLRHRVVQYFGELFAMQNFPLCSAQDLQTSQWACRRF